MDIEYETDQVLSPDDLRTTIVALLDAVIVEPADGSQMFLRAPGVDITCLALPEHDDDPEQEAMEQRHAAHMGFRRRSLVAFRLRGTATAEESDAAWAQILNLAVELPSRHPGNAALVLDFERVLMRATPQAGITFDTWDGFTEDPELMAIVSKHGQLTLDQPLL
ncbi:hypothetical protein AB0H43_13910 [Hamadaea sp. NPDC050747]|uniref:hypothetical protein n=1 Tax=Hamadaea sp. NPDC050747 TaxID=3155789 RepID=UPI0033CB9431